MIFSNKIYAVFSVILIIILAVSCQSASEKRNNYSEDIELIGKWRGCRIDPERPSQNLARQPCWIIERKEGGILSVTEFIVNHEKKLYVKIGSLTEGEWKTNGDSMLIKLKGDTDWSEKIVSRKDGILMFKAKDSEEYDLEEKIDEFQTGYSSDYSSTSEEVFER